MGGLMISVIELIVWLSIAFFALLVRISIGILNLASTVIGWALGREPTPRAVDRETIGQRYGVLIGVGLLTAIGAAIYIHRNGQPAY